MSASLLDIETKRKLREMNATDLLTAIDSQDPVVSAGMPFEDRLRLAVDEAYSSFTHSKVTGLIRRAGLRYPNADLRRIDRGTRGSRRGGIVTAVFQCVSDPAVHGSKSFRAVEIVGQVATHPCDDVVDAWRRR